MRLLEYDLGDRVTAFSSMREGGVSTGNYASFNINHYCGDSEENIAKNLSILAERLNIDTDRFVYPHQTHSSEFRFITPEFFDLQQEEKETKISNEHHFRLITDICNNFYTNLQNHDDFNHKISWRTYSNLEPIQIQINTTETFPGVCDLIKTNNKEKLLNNNFLLNYLNY